MKRTHNALDTSSAKSQKARPAAFLDRDGTLNVDDGYVHRIDDFRWIEGAREAIRLLNNRGFLVFVVTNQSGVARGLYDTAAVERLHAWMQQDLARDGAMIDAFRYCPHHPHGSVPGFTRRCDCRKPEAGMLLDLISSWQPDLSSSFMLGDSERDLEAARRAGIAGHLVRAGNTLSVVTRLLAGTGG